MNKRVVITGIGPYIHGGKGKEVLWEAVINKTVVPGRIPASFEKITSFNSKYYIPFPQIKYEETELNPKFRQITDNTSRISIICAKTAIEDAGYELSSNGDIPFFNNDLSGAAIIMGIGICGLRTSFDNFVIHSLGHKPEILNEMNLVSHFNRMVVPQIMPNSITGWISILFGMHGENFTINTACSSGNYAIGEAYRKIKDGYYDIVLAGGVENFEDNTGTIMRGFDSLGVLTKSVDGRPMPFSKSRSGFLFAEGAACILVMEEYERALKRNANIYAEIAGYESNSDTKNIVLMDEKGTNIKNIIQKLSNDNVIDYINAHGTGTILNDEVESKVIKTVFGCKSKQPLINSSKSILGHTIGASAALEAAITAMSVQREMIHANISVDNIDDLNIAETTIHRKINSALSLSYGFGGHNSGLLIKKFIPN
jgi:3-oxoacyl-[acyl-carrier-protein] synthase II